MRVSYSESDLKENIATLLDERRVELTETLRVVDSVRGTVLATRACAMAVPMIYAQWEGFAKEALQLYVEYLENCDCIQQEFNESILAYAWTPSFRKLQGELTHDRKVELIQRFLGSLSEVLQFSQSEREIDTKSNLKFDVLNDMAKYLCLNIDSMRQYEKKLDTLVHRRNNIAHGARAKDLDHALVDDYKNLALQLMEGLEKVLTDAVDNVRYKKQTIAVAAEKGESANR